MKLDFSHLGIFVNDLEQMSLFYIDVMGFAQTDVGKLGEVDLVFLSKDPMEHHQLVLVSGRPEQLQFNTVNQISFRTDSLASLREFHQMVATHPKCSDIAPINHGVAWSVYFRDPEGNRIEVFVDSPFYINQPVREPLDLLALDDQAILDMTEARCRAEDSFQPIAQWRAAFAEKLTN